MGIMATLLPDYIVGIGGSAGSLSPFKAFLECISPTTGMAFIFVSHLLPTATSNLHLILARSTNMPVFIISDGLPILADHVYVMPPNVDIFVDGFTLKLISPPMKTSKQIDRLFVSLADTFGEKAIGIILSGYCSDGTEGCKRIKALGGSTFAQDGSAEIPFMPINAQATGCIDLVLPPCEIAGSLQKLARKLIYDGHTCYACDESIIGGGGGVASDIWLFGATPRPAPPGPRLRFAAARRRPAALGFASWLSGRPVEIRRHLVFS
jgi:chemotaxis response regulator CheB